MLSESRRVRQHRSTGFCFIVAVNCAPGGSGPGTSTKPSYSRSLETSLRNELFTLGSYSELQRPQERMSVKVSLTVLTVNDLDIKNQVMSVSGYLSLSWFDERLSWDNTSATSQDYTNIRFLFSTETYVWRPAIIIENSVQDISVISDKNIPMRIMSTGYITWNPAGIYLVACSCDITYYPLDEQTCTIKVSTWGYTSNEISLQFDNPAVDMSFYSENGEWLLTDAAGENTKEMSRGGQTFSSLTFSITLKRRPMFHALNTMVPVALMAFLIPMVFKLPVDSGEKIGYSLTVLLAYAVYLTLISDNIPSTSVSVCYLSKNLTY
ncbi:neuronal acetylcholine receptor subunit alpha-2-like [Saccostrea echinata]|uniref:neuronal acetylcholine receptor subunit alpha-2-like n=1 Tax=Saccostrea echinata TaxID=191078 RepID=UPI002A81114B|nr:neuronal acetylcholine receptor subunit alpha-2-like [Saccostrea echinata]